MTLGNLSQTYTGTTRTATVTTNPAGLVVGLTYNGSATPPTNAGSYAVVATVSTANYAGTATGTLTISTTSATVTLSNLTQTYTGTPRTATVTTAPAKLSVNLTYNDSTTAPTIPGSYTVVATVTEANHVGSATGTLAINNGQGDGGAVEPVAEV